MNKSIGIALMLLGLSAHAEPDAVVQAVQMPAWIQRGDSSAPMRVGTELQNGDKLITGANARVYVRTADGSTVKLGEMATLTLGGLLPQRQQESVFRALLDIAKGAFRFTTATVARSKGRDVTVKVAGATVGIRGTDVWGKDGKDEKGDDLRVVCLIEGNISVLGADQHEFSMDQPMSFYKMPAGAAPLPVTPVEPEQLKKWAAETEITRPASLPGGKWKVNLFSTSDQQIALAAYDRWRAAGYDVRLHPVEHEGGLVYILRIVQLPGRVEAEQLAKLLKGTLGAENPSASR
jgi:hypothetical protein